MQIFRLNIFSFHDELHDTDYGKDACYLEVC